MDRANKTKTPLSNFHPWQGFHVFQAASCEERIGTVQHLQNHLQIKLKVISQLK
ncbi:MULTISPECIES: hypothetical protein [unclassified Methanosarcina]|uniref:hypothetical protein n=1 Tax=unclassified Methanosarcina TaxID=2644672 RepID=UPI000B1B5F32|nr:MULTISPECIES: hypothetical protein [unclassified Methanosarcina]